MEYGRGHFMNSAPRLQEEKERAAAAMDREIRGLGLGGAALGVGYAAESVKRTGELPSAIELMERNLMVLQDALNALNGRLEGVLRPAEPMPARPPEQAHPASPMSGYASTVHVQAQRLSILTEQVQDLLRRLEV